MSEWIKNEESKSMKTKSVLMKYVPKKTLEQLNALRIGNETYTQIFVRIVKDAYKELK